MCVCIYNFNIVLLGFSLDYKFKNDVTICPLRLPNAQLHIRNLDLWVALVSAFPCARPWNAHQETHPLVAPEE